MDATQRAAARFRVRECRVISNSRVALRLPLLVLLLAACGAEISDSAVPPTAEDTIGSGSTASTGTTTQRGSAGRGSQASQPWMPQDTPTAMPMAGSKSQAGSAGAPSTVKTAGPAAGSGGTGGSGAAGSGGSELAPKPDATSSGGAAGKASDNPNVVAGDVRWLGRVDASDPKHVSFSWSGSGFAAVVKVDKGSSVSVHLESQGDAVYYVPVVDGKTGERIKVEEGEHVVTLADGLSDGEHEIELYRDTEGDGPVSVFSGFEEGSLVGAPKDSGRFFEIVGDSITVGFGSRGMERHGDNPSECGADHSTSSWFLSYEAVAARALGAEVSTVARSGYGVYRGYGMNMNVMPPLFDHAQGNEDDPRWKFERQPAALIINLGTNDWNGGDPGTAFETAYIKFVEDVREHYPDTLILLTIGPTLEDGRKRQVQERLERVIDARHSDGDDKIDSFDIGIQDTDVTGCGWHPNEAEHKRVGMLLADELRMRLKW